jgi:hypothetical protein
MQLNIAALMGKLEAPGGTSASFGRCHTGKNDNRQTVIVDYGTDLNQLDTFVLKTGQDFNNAFLTGGMGNINSQMPSQQNIEDSKKLAEKLKNMTPEEQKQWAMQMAQEKQKGAGASSIQDDAQTAKLVFQTQDIAVNQLKRMNDEFAAKLRDLNVALSKEKAQVKIGDKSGCAQDKTGLPSCVCANEINGKYWQKIVSITDSYNNQRTHCYKVIFQESKRLLLQ